MKTPSKNRSGFLRPAVSIAALALAWNFVACNAIFGITPGRERGAAGGAGASGMGGLGTSSNGGAGHGGNASTGTRSSSGGSSAGGHGGIGGGVSSAGGGGASSASGGSPNVSLQDCVLLMHMDEASWSGAGSVIDSSGQNNNGTPVGTATTTTSGRFGGAALFDGGGYINVPDSVSLHPTDSLTLSAWVYPTGLDNPNVYPSIISKRQDYAVNVAFTFFIWTGHSLWSDIDTTRMFGSALFHNSHWYHVALVYDGTKPKPAKRVQFYVDGQPDAYTNDNSIPLPTTIPMNTVDLTIGWLTLSTDDPNAYFVGRIDEVAMWTRALDATEIGALAHATGPLGP